MVKQVDFERIDETSNISQQIVRSDKFGNSFYYFLKDELVDSSAEAPQMLTDIFDASKKRIRKERSVSLPVLPNL